MSKKYGPKKMMNSSRFVDLLDGMSQEDLDKVADKIGVYVKENPEYCDKGNYRHLSNIFTCMAIYRTLIEKGKSPQEAEEITFNAMYQYMQKQRKTFQRLSKKGWFWGLIKKIVPLGFKKGSGYGWEYAWHKDDPKNQFNFECRRCIYQQLFKKYDLVRFGPKFCYNDIVVYGELDRTDFKRTKTLCRGDEECDFKFVRYKKDEKFERSQSV